jgi:hypothetical protein
MAQELLADAKENAEHIMLVDLARNDLSRCCDQVAVSHFRQVHYYSHVIHLVSEVIGNCKPGKHPVELLAATLRQWKSLTNLSLHPGLIMAVVLEPLVLMDLVIMPS